MQCPGQSRQCSYRPCLIREGPWRTLTGRDRPLWSPPTSLRAPLNLTLPSVSHDEHECRKRGEADAVGAAAGAGEVTCGIVTGEAELGGGDGGGPG